MNKTRQGAAAFMRIKDLKERQEPSMSNVFGLCVVSVRSGRTILRPSPEEQMPPTDITQDMKVPAFHVNKNNA